MSEIRKYPKFLERRLPSRISPNEAPQKVKFNYCQCDVTLPIEQHIPPEPGGAIHKTLLIVIIARENILDIPEMLGS